MMLHQSHEIIKIPDRSRKTVKQELDKFISDHEGKKPLSIRVGESLLDVVRGFGIPVSFASGLQDDEIVIIT